VRSTCILVILTESTKCGKCFGGPKGSFSAKRHNITCKKDLQKKFINVIFALKSLSYSLVGTVIKQHVFFGHKYTLNSAKASINIYAV
jgi:hypothetical protein